MTRFKHEMTVKATIKKKKKGFDLFEITEEDLKKAKESTFEKPYIKKGKEGIFEMFYDDVHKSVQVHWYLSFEGFAYIGDKPKGEGGKNV